MSDELAPQHAQIGIGFVSMGDVAVRIILGIRWSMESVAGGMHADESHAAMNGVEQRLLALR